MVQKKKSNRVNPDQILRGQMDRRTAAAVKQHEAFAAEHRGASREELIAYVRQCSEKLGHTPYPVEVIGSPFIAGYFEGGWSHMLQAAELLPLPEYIGKVGADRASEFKRQTEHHRRVKAQKQARREARQKEKQAAKANWPPAGTSRKKTPGEKRKAEEKALRVEADMVWGREHETDTDAQLLEYLRQCAGSLPEGRALRKNQVQGGYYIAKRFIKWTVALYLAELLLPEGCEPVTQKDLDDYASLSANREAVGAGSR